MQEFHPVKYFAPGWFAVIMGTGGLGNIIFLWQTTFPFCRYLGMAFAFLADSLYFIVLLLWLLRWFLYFPYVTRDLRHPIQSNFFVTMAVATTILGTNLHLIWNPHFSRTSLFTITFVLWLISILGVTFFTFFTTFKIIRDEASPLPETMNFSWIMAPIANMAVLLNGNPVLALTIDLRPAWAMSVFMTNLILLGIGFFLFLFISAVIFVRLIQHPLPPSETTPSFGIFLSAVGLAVIAILDTANNSHHMGLLQSTDLLFIGAAIIWGFGVWIVGIITIICIYQIRRGGIPFNLGWWAFIFPLAAYTISSQKITAYFSSPLTIGYTFFLTILLLSLWLLTSFYTLRNVLSGKIFLGTPINH
ncbi:C4-dicarboxylate transporter/malic acid transport protein [Syntrophobotulus glycolicus DSM 8271]|uniref:C4-dicarboxylate transporter/malic acid transport protein n=1 Tax=Syntrophobotulus glycolicus (strain DSM 8271 / FlGlyR) TaxID=645991 RepID=F0T2E3_SYNGF|nr:C4-dicarboxylate ABC transporter [Syntrophobotulus glycolicus]ADY57571.1 C4-dicarboxylate transporter/malic acid transport protein [Syntrophobotulus glycolicus DSM 8271]